MTLASERRLVAILFTDLVETPGDETLSIFASALDRRQGQQPVALPKGVPLSTSDT